MKPLTALAVQRLQTSAFVGGAPGLQLSVSPGGTRSWRLFYRLPGSTKRRAMTLGRYPDVSLADARHAAMEKLKLAASGEDPRLERESKTRRRDFIIAAAIDEYIVWCASNNDRRTVDAKRSALNTHIRPNWSNSPLVEIRRRHIIERLDALHDRPGIRRALYTYLSHFFGWCLERELIEANPIAEVKPPRPVPSRDRVLTDEEIAALMGAQGVMATIAKLALLTAQRKGSVEAMRWLDIDMERAAWSIPADHMKSGRLHDVPLSAPAMTILADWPRLAGPFVFGVGTDGANPYAGASNGMEGLRRQLGDPDWRLHDLRRTAVTLAQRAGCPLDAVRALTQHKTPGVIGVYARHAFSEEKREVVEAIAGQIEALQ